MLLVFLKINISLYLQSRGSPGTVATLSKVQLMVCPVVSKPEDGQDLLLYAR